MRLFAIDAILLRPLPAPHARRIVDASTTTATVQFGSVAYPDYVDLHDQTKTLQALTPMGYTANRDAVPKTALGAIVSWNFFSGRVDVPIGRSFRPDEDQTPGRDLVIQTRIRRPFHQDTPKKFESCALATLILNSRNQQGGRFLQ